ncbi:MAG: hypothetical protein ACREM9_10395 [Gemmatimonadales bacterium]
MPPRLLMCFTLAALLLAACEPGTAPEAPAAIEAAVDPQFAARPNPSFQPFAFSVDNCVETVDLSGTFHEVVQFFVGPGGKEHFRFHINAKGTGVGQLTGARYQWNDRLFDITNIAPAGAVSFTLNDNARLIGQGRAANFRAAVRIKLTINAAGVVAVDRFVARVTCG